MKLRGDAREVYRRILSLLERKAGFKEASEELRKYEPVSDESEILERQKVVGELIEKAKKVDFEKLEALKEFEFKRRFFEDRCFVAKNEEEYEKASSLKVCDVSFSPTNHTILLNYEIDAEPKIEHVAPEVFVVPLIENLESLKALAEVEKVVDGKDDTFSLLEDVKKIEELYKRIKEVEKVEEELHNALSELNARIEERLESVKVVLSGKELLSIGESDALEKLREVIEEEVRRAEEELHEKFGFYENVFTTGYPVRLIDESVRNLKRKLEERYSIDFYFQCRRIVEKHNVNELNEKVKRFRALALYKALEDFRFPKIGEGIKIVKGRNLFIENPQPIDYYLGADRYKERVAILTGANSGGKTSLLELVCQVVILAHMGFPVNAEESEICVFDELFFFKRKRTNYGSGAFESAIRSFVKEVARKGRKLLLVDEFEAITEPGAAVKILKKILEIVHDSGDFAIVVSHLGDELSELEFARVDGIEAKGLDENFQLIVDRQPIFGKIGRSTPELIIEKLRKTSRGKEKEIYEELIKSFGGRR